MTLQEALKVSGKVTHPMYDGFYFLDKSGLQYHLNGRDYLATISFNASLDENWQPYKKPCEHEQNIPDTLAFKSEFISTSYVLDFLSRCRHCNVKIKATGWEAV